ncbi:MAG: ADP-forming succinate--CoA ligase subunit beta [Bacteroidales bacterium]|jgi:succinyl-CoA synthetase beta subunit|nr:ADP-forming succinate--CoA ligase subunit beta [Bacteroidales bacterium]
MNIHEFQGKSLLKKHNVAIQEGFVAETSEEAVAAAEKLSEMFGSGVVAIKAQIHAGGRGKGGGVKLAKSKEDVREISKQILGMQLVTPQTGPAGKKVRKVLVAQDAYYHGNSEPSEFYISILLNRDKGKDVFIYSPAGGMSIEEVSEQSPELIFSEEIEPNIGLQPFQVKKIAFSLGLSGDAFKNMQKFLRGIYETYKDADAQLLEINPALKASDNRILAVDCKMTIDDNALFRQPELAAMRDIHEENPDEVEAGKHSLNFIKLDGNIGCMVNGAGLAMATMDIIKLSGGAPANFLDVGGGASAKAVEAGFRIILNDKNVKAILINIFGGIVRCDMVASGIVEAYRSMGAIDIPVIVRLQGTNAVEARKIIDSSGLKVVSAETFGEAAALVAKTLGK